MRSRHTKAYTSPARLPGSSALSDAICGIVARHLSDRGLTIRAWARSRGWAPRSVYAVVSIWVEHPARRGRVPLGGRYEAIARDLQDALGDAVVPLPPPLERAA